jgi:hypothetical protein
MRRIWTWTIAAALLAGTAPALRAETATVKGELVSIMCVEGNGDKGRGAAHVDCAVRCAKQGYQLGVITDDGTLYKIDGPLTANNNEKLQPLLAKTVTATGDVTTVDGSRVLKASDVAEAK